MQDHIARRYALFALGLTAIAFGVVIVTKADLGTSPITSVPYSLSLISDAISFGAWTIVFNFVLIALQFVLIGKEAKKLNPLMQVVLSFVFGYLIDLIMAAFSWFEPSFYPLKIACVVLGCFIIAFGVYLQILGAVALLPGDAFVLAVKMRTKAEYGRVRVTNDISLVAISLVISLVFLGSFGGVREGTVICAATVGLIVRLYNKRLSRLSGFLLPSKDPKS